MEENKANVEEEVLETNEEEVNADNSTDEVEAEVDTVQTL